MKYYFKYYLILLLIVFGAIIAGQFLLSFKYSFPYAPEVLYKMGPWWFWPLGNFDGVHYLLLAREGYIRDLYQAFFPVYPMLLRFFEQFTRNYLVSGVVLSAASFWAVLYFFNKLLCLDFKNSTVRKILLVFVFFPTSFYFFSVYTESLFMALVFAFFYYLRKKKYLLAVLLAGTASATRLVGVFLVLSFLYEVWPVITNIKTYSRLFHLLGVKNSPTRRCLQYLITGVLSLIGVFGFLFYSYFLMHRYSDPLKFLHVQSAFGANRSSGELVLLYQVIYRYFKMFITVDPKNPIYYSLSLEFAISLLFLVFIAVAFLNKKLKINKNYILFSSLAFILPTLTGTFSSMPRYVLSSFVGFMVLGQIKNKALFRFWMISSVGLLLINAVLFYRGYWIA